MKEGVVTRMRNSAIAAGLTSLCLLLGSVSVVGAEAMKLRLALPTSPASYMLPMYVAKDQGWLSKAGLEVEENYLVGDAAVVRAILSGNADIGAPGVFAVYPAIAEGGKIKAFGSWQPTTDYWVIAHKKFKTVEDLKSASIASFGPTGLSMEIPKLLLKTKGVDTSRVNFVSVGGMSDRLKAVLAGKVDATMIDTLFATKALESPDFHIVASIAKEFPQIAYIYLVGAERVLREKRKEVELFTRYAIVQGSRLIMKNPDVAVAALHKRLPDLEPKFIRSIVDRLVETGVFGTDGGLDRAVTEFTVNLGLETGTLKKRVTFEEVADTSFVDKVLAEDGRYGK
jgi:ABC-type nitrate/sulfonate/bicarbonate transport system substrate-binding protein